MRSVFVFVLILWASFLLKAEPQPMLLGQIDWDNSQGTWTEELKQFVTESFNRGKIVAQSVAFHDCMNEVLTNSHNELPAYLGYYGPYVGCAADPLQDLTLEEQRKKIMDVCQSPYDVTMTLDDDNNMNVGACSPFCYDVATMVNENTGQLVCEPYYTALRGHNAFLSDTPCDSNGQCPEANMFCNYGANKCEILCNTNEDCPSGSACEADSDADPTQNKCKKTCDLYSSTPDERMQCTICLSCVPEFTAYAPFYSYDTTHESFTWCYNALKQKREIALNDSLWPPDATNFDWLNTFYWTPYSQTASIIWHEVMHNHDYNHVEKELCETEQYPNWSWVLNTVPNLVGVCIKAVLNASYFCPEPACPAPDMAIISEWPPIATLPGVSYQCVCGSDARDHDYDRVPDNIDNCPDVSNPDQADRDGNDIGDACDDGDDDGVVDLLDNCPADPNPEEDVSPYQELVSAPCEDYLLGYCRTGGAAAKGYAQINLFSGSITLLNGKTFPVWFPNAKWQPDHDLDGIGDVCDRENYTFVNKNGETITADGFGYSLLTSTSFPVEDNSGGLGLSFTNHDKYVKIDQTLLDGKDFPGNQTVYKRKATLQYCGINAFQYSQNLWGADGHCATAHGSQTKYPNKPLINFGFSHGTDTMSISGLNTSPWDMRISWGKNSDNIPNDFLGKSRPPYTGDLRRPLVEISTDSKENSIYWNWRRDWWERNRCDDNGSLDQCQGLYTPTMGATISDYNFHYILSSGIYPDTTEDYPDQSYLLNGTVNEDYFLNSQKYARSFREGIGPFTLNYQSSRFVVPPIRPFPEIIMPTCLSCYLKLPAEALRPVEHPWDDYAQWLIYKDRAGGIEFVATKKQRPPSNIIYEGEGHILYSVEVLDNSYALVAGYPGEFSPDWHRIGTIEGWDQIGTISTIAQLGDKFIILAKNGGPAPVSLEVIYTITAEQTGTAMQGDVELPTFTYSVTAKAATALDSLIGKQLVTVGDAVYLLARNGSNNTTTLRKLDTANWTISTPIATTVSPAARDIYNVGSIGTKLYLAGGLAANGDEFKDIWSFDTETEQWTKLYDNLTIDMRKLIMEPIDGTLVMANPVLEFHQTTHAAVAINLTDGTLSYPEVPVMESPDYLLDFVEGYCLNETETEVKGGTYTGGTCTPFTHPWYKQYSIGTTVYSVAGKGNRLYVGTSNAIKVYDISDPNAMVLKSTFTTNKIVYDLEVVDGDIMYAATSGGLYKLNTVNPDTLTSLLFFSTPYNYQYRIQLYNGNLYVGDDNGINIRNPESFARVAYVNIGSTMDFSIANGEIAMYWDDFWSSGIDIRDVDNLATRKAWDYPYCSTGELTTDHGAFYLSCDGYEYRFVGLPNTYLDYFELNGDMREMQENYLYNGWVYIPDGNKVKLSTNNTVPAICGNGIIEPGEFCDGNSVECLELDPQQWDSGTAYCNSTCTAYDTGDCYDSGC